MEIALDTQEKFQRPRHWGQPSPFLARRELVESLVEIIDNTPSALGPQHKRYDDWSRSADVPSEICGGKDIGAQYCERR